MHPYRKLINESFFNPLLHFIPLLLFLISKSIFGNSTALVIVYFSVVAILLYSYVLYVHLYKFLGVSYMVSTAIISTIIFFPEIPYLGTINKVLPEYIVFFSFLLILILREKITQFVSNKTPGHLAMTNNLNEHFRIVWLFTTVFFIYIHSYLLISWYSPENTGLKLFIYQLYLAVLFFVIIHEFIRVTLIRIKLYKETWWPIVNDKGQVTGSIQSQLSAVNNHKLTHPVIRILQVNNSMVFLSRNPDTHMWDCKYEEHIRMNETIDECIKRIYPNADLSINTKPTFITKYLAEKESEFQFIYLFLDCNLSNIKEIEICNSNNKWWTLMQIEENKNEGIFKPNFNNEIEILKRMGLLESSSFKCNCILKETVYKAVNKTTNTDNN